MRLLDLTLPLPAENLALDEALLLEAEEHAGGEILRFWELSSLAVVVGAGGSVIVDVNTAACETDGIPILRRSSGGGTVMLGPGCLCFSLVLAYDRAPGLDQIAASNRYVLGRMLNALQTIAPNASIEGTSDLALMQGEAIKISGNAQQRKRRHFLHHGTLLCGFNLSTIAKYLDAPERQPPYRQNRLHKDFLANLSAHPSELKTLIEKEWQPAGDYSSIPEDMVRKLVADKYSRDDWNRRR
jgi:lipoate-protein ligase A